MQVRNIPKTLTRLALLLALFLPSAAGAKRAPRVAVFELELRNVRIKRSMVRILRDYLSDQLAATRAYRVVPGDKIRAALMRGQLRSRKVCFAKSCQIRVGRALAADRSLSTRVMRIGRRCVVTATLFNLETQVTEKGATAKSGCSEEQIQAAIDVIVAKLAGRSRRSISAVRAPPVPAPAGRGRSSAQSLPPVASDPGSGGSADESLPPVATEAGHLRVEGSPRGARVDVKGPRGFKGPAAVALPRSWQNIPPGRYQVKVRAPDHDPYETRVRVRTDRTRLLTVELVKAYGSLTIGGAPLGARVEVSCPGGFRKVFGLTRRFTLKRARRGSCRVQVSRTGFVPYQKRVEVKGGQRSRVTVKLEQAYGRLTLGGQPRGARVDLRCAGGFRKVFGLPRSVTLKRVPRGTCGVKVSRTGYTSYAREVEVQGGKEARLAVKLEQVELRKAGAVRLIRGRLGLQWVLIPGGSFRMGSTAVAPDEQPVHGVRVRSFYLGQTEVTMAQYRACVNSGVCSSAHVGDGTCYTYKDSSWSKGNLPSSFQGNQQPVVCVDWRQAQKYCSWAGGRLPSEAEWEYAARSGGRAQKYPWGDENASCRRAVMDDGGNGCGKGRTWSVCSRTAGNTAQGLCDMAGNVWEWTEDCLHSNYTGHMSYNGAPSDGSAWTASCSSSSRVLRGGSWDLGASNLRAAIRVVNAPTDRSRDVGFRCARTKN